MLQRLGALLPLLESEPRGEWCDAIERNVKDMWKEEDAKAHLSSALLNPELLFGEFSNVCPDDAIIAADTGMSTTFFARAIKMRRGMKTAISGTLATMGPAVSYALTAGHEVVEDYTFTGLTLRQHPVSFLRSELTEKRIVTCAEASALPGRQKMITAGLVLVRQKPGSAKGVMFITIEDETGVANLVIWPSLREAEANNLGGQHARRGRPGAA